MDVSPGSPGDQKTILAVDDDPDILNVVSELLLVGGHNVFTADNSANALRQAKDYKGDIHLLLSDSQMPGMSGIEFGYCHECGPASTRC